MTSALLFSDNNASDPLYRNIREPKSDRLNQMKAHCEDLWSTFAPYADAEFRTEIKSTFHARYWEMYLTSYFIRAGFDVTCPKPGPDIGITFDGRRIWIEAVTVTRGAAGSPDQVPEILSGEAQDTPNDKIVLRYLNSISEKCDRQYAKWLSNGTVEADEAFLIALNPALLSWEYADTEPPRILQAAFTLGSLYATIDRDTVQVTRTGYHFKNTIQKASGATVGTGVFQLEKFISLSGLLCSRVHASDIDIPLGEDFQLVPNPNSAVPLPPAFRLPGTYFAVASSAEGYVVSAQDDLPDY